MKPQLSKAAQQLREQFDDTFPGRDRTSDGWIGDTRHLALAIIIPMLRAGFVPSMLIVMSVVSPNQISCQILQIRFVSYASLKRNAELPTLSLMVVSPQAKKVGHGENTQGLTNTHNTVTSRFRKKLTMMGLFFKYLC